MKFLNYLFLGLLAVFISCKSSKNITDASGIKSMSARKVAKKHVAANFNKKTIDAKYKVTYKDNDESIGFSVKMSLKKDEVIWIKGTKLITVFKAKITPTKVSFYSPYKKNYFEGDFSMLKELLGTEVNFYQLQNMLLGQSIEDVKKSKQEMIIANKSYQLSPKKQPELFDIFYWINPTNFKLNKQSLVSIEKNQRLDVNYKNYVSKKGTLLPKELLISAKENSKTTQIKMDLRSVAINTNVAMSFKIPKGYKEIKL
ncbi:DUF4292 domain-containing protein [Tenacibaculum geojense]|uniref:DUF4292 domain-containing protein n=1 Tax=Tenacibaculum geojense TaxID=915352 RepID=A0ABW3JQT4_9FLAO